MERIRGDRLTCGNLALLPDQIKAYSHNVDDNNWTLWREKAERKWRDRLSQMVRVQGRLFNASFTLNDNERRSRLT